MSRDGFKDGHHAGMMEGRTGGDPSRPSAKCHPYRDSHKTYYGTSITVLLQCLRKECLRLSPPNVLLVG